MLPDIFDVEQIQMQYPVRCGAAAARGAWVTPLAPSALPHALPLFCRYEESMNTVLAQECIRYNRLLVVMKKSLVEVQRALKGLVVMSAELEEMGTCCYNQRVPPTVRARGGGGGAWPQRRARQARARVLVNVLTN